jgi:hypothetical protein
MYWIIHIRQFLWQINATLEIQDLWLPKKQFQHDQFLMTAFVSMKASPTELTILNNWRVYYKVMLLSEICFATGTGIHPYYLEYEHDKNSNNIQSTLNWPLQGKPDETSFKIWKRYLRLCFLNNNNHRPQPLGSWDIQEIQRISPRHAYYLQSEQAVYTKHTEGGYDKFVAYNIGRSSASYDPNQLSQRTSELPQEVIPIDTYKYPESVVINFTNTQPHISKYQSLDNQKWKKQFVRHLSIADLINLRQALEDEESSICIVSDGGVHNYHGNYGVVMAQSTNILAKTMGKLYSVEFNESSYR